jgi:hypothetical protein
MRALDLTAMREAVTTFVQRVSAEQPVDVLVVGGLLIAVIVLTLVAIWKSRKSTRTEQLIAPPAESGFMRWLTPMGMKSVSPTQAVVVRKRLKTGSTKTVRVITPVSKVPARALRAAGASPLEIARRTGLARDAVSMMMANAGATPVSRPTRALPTTLTRSVKAERKQLTTGAPTSYAAASAASAPAPRGTSGPVGTRFTARLS